MNNWKRKVFPYVLVMPTVLLFCTYIFYPALSGFVYSFQKWDGIGPMKYVGLANFEKLITDSGFLSSLQRTAVYTIISIPLIFCAALAMALVVSRELRGVGFFRMSFYFPFMLSPVIIGFSWRFLLTSDFGLISYLSQSLGSTPIEFLTDKNLAMATVIFITVWGSAGYYMMMFVAGLKSISPTYYEAAKLDGANAVQSFVHITFPLLKPTSLLVIVLSTIGVLKSYALVNSVTGGGPGAATKFLVQLIYETAFKKNKMGYASAMTIVLFLILTILTVIQFKLNKGEEQDAD